jgi:Leucine-rich repeat (LRR) protein
MIATFQNKLLTTLPVLHKDLEVLWCYGNLLTELPLLPQKLVELECYNNPMTQLPPLPHSLEMRWISPWQALSCLNKLSNLETTIIIRN